MIIQDGRWFPGGAFLSPGSALPSHLAMFQEQKQHHKKCQVQRRDLFFSHGKREWPWLRIRNFMESRKNM